MRTLKPLSEIPVPEVKPEQTYVLEAFEKKYSFTGLKKLLAAADYSKAGDRNAGLAAKTEVEREAARTLLSRLTLQHLYDHPLTDKNGKIDSVMRVNYDISLDKFKTISKCTVGEFKDKLLSESEEQVTAYGSALTGVMAAAVAKLCDTHELVYIARKIKRQSKARTHLGLPGTLSSRLQPNHPSDDLRGLSLLIYTSFSLGGGDALIGVNPAIDTVENISSMLVHLDRLRKKTGAPTQICVLSHVKTQMKCLENGVPVEIMFQSLAGTEDTNLTEFDFTTDILDDAYRLMQKKGPLRDVAKQFMYFETGQGSEFTYGKHNHTDMATLEALCYGLARRYDPFMVNNVTGFIGPETHVDNFEMIISNLQDHFMGKLLGIPMGMAPCYTLHSKITLEGQQMATQLLASAGANYYMDVYLNNDRMLAYFDTSAHDSQTLRELHDRTPNPEFLDWALTKGVFTKENGKVKRGPQWGNPKIFCESEIEFKALCDVTPALYGFENAGARPKDKVSRDLKLNQAEARAATYAELDITALDKMVSFVHCDTKANSREEHLNSPSLGAFLSDKSKEALTETKDDVQVVVSDGLSSEAVHHNIYELYPILSDGLRGKKIKSGNPLLVRYGRVKLSEDISEVTKAKVVLLLIGERPGGDAYASRSLSAYFLYRLDSEAARKKAIEFSGNSQIRYEYTVISNIYSKGLPPSEAASVIVEKLEAILKHQAAGNRLESLLAKA